MKKIISLTLVLCLTVMLSACSTDTYTIESESDTFKLKTVTSITMEGPNDTDASGTVITLDNTMHTTDFQRMIELIQGKKTDQCPTGAFLSKITFTFESGKTTTVYPAVDGSNFVALYSVNPSIAQYIELPEEDMKEVLQIMKKHGIAVSF